MEVELAADVIRKADFLLLSTGAGMSADSGLPVYKDVAKFEAYKTMGVTYRDLCTPLWLSRKPEIFYGFWGTCWNDYRSTKPHPGHNIIKSWVSTHFDCRVDPFFVYTSNVDSHSISSGLVDPEHVFEIHGSMKRWQCSTRRLSFSYQ